MKMVDGKLVPDSSPAHTADPIHELTRSNPAPNALSKAHNSDTQSNQSNQDFQVGKSAETHKVKTVETSAILRPSPDSGLTPNITVPVEQVVEKEVKGNPVNKGNLPIESHGFVAPDTHNLGQNTGKLKPSDEPVQGYRATRDEFKIHKPEDLAAAQVSNVSKLTDDTVGESGSISNNIITASQKIKMIEASLKNKGMDSMQLINAMAEIKSILGW